jgi:hypothetical protein
MLSVLVFALKGSAQTIASSPVGATDMDFFRWAVTQGGLVVVVLVIFWSYRRDLAGLLKEEQQRTRVLTDLVERNTVALTRLVDAVDRCPANRGHHAD